MKRGQKYDEAVSLIVASALENASETIFVEKTCENSVEAYVRIAVYSVWDGIESYGFDFTRAQIEQIEREVRRHAEMNYYLSDSALRGV